MNGIIVCTNGFLLNERLQKEVGLSTNLPCSARELLITVNDECTIV
jgi:hypothetical protein